MALPFAHNGIDSFRSTPSSNSALEHTRRESSSAQSQQFESPVGRPPQHPAREILNRPSDQDKGYWNHLPLPTPSLSVTQSFDSSHYNEGTKLPPMNIGHGLSHPFENYWTMKGGVKEVVEQLPSKDQCDILVERYFECVDALYPIIHKPTFMMEYNNFFSSMPSVQANWDGAWIARLFVMLAAGTQFYPIAARVGETQKTINFYISAAYQALTLASYLNKASIVSLQAMIILVYALMNIGHVSDGWAFSGVIIRQAQSLGLHRNPERLTHFTGISKFHKQERLRIWQAVRLQDTFLALLISKPPLAILTDCEASSFGVRDPNDRNEENDLHYIAAMWDFTSIIQKALCEPLALDLPPVPTKEKRIEIVNSLDRVWQSITPDLRELTDGQIAQLFYQNPRVVNQLLFVRNNYYNCIMIANQLDCTYDPRDGRRYNDEAIRAAMKALDAYLLLHALVGYKARIWWILTHRSFTQCVLLARCLESPASSSTGKSDDRGGTDGGISTGGGGGAVGAGDDGDEESSADKARGHALDKKMAGYVRQMIAIFELEINRQDAALGRVAELKEFLVRAGVDWRFSSA